jgi:uncharacterized Zn finger protein
VTASTQAKAVRLADTGKVRRLSPVEVFEVEGDHGTYTVVLAGGETSCTCPAHGGCSHIVAVDLVRRSNRMNEIRRAAGELCARAMIAQRAGQDDVADELWAQAGGILDDADRLCNGGLTDEERARGEAAIAAAQG